MPTIGLSPAAAAETETAALAAATAPTTSSAALVASTASGYLTAFNLSASPVAGSVRLESGLESVSPPAMGSVVRRLAI